jgi:tricorn protease
MPAEGILAMTRKLLVIIALIEFFAAAQSKLPRFLDVPGEKVVCSDAGELWRAPVAGGTARRLTAHPGRELFARFAPDGQWIAFTAQ